MSRSVKLVAFDIDDTLFSERLYVRSGFEAVGRYAKQRWKIHDFAERAWRLFEEGKRGFIFDRVLDAAGCRWSLQDVEELVKIYREHHPAIKLFPDAEHVLGFLASRCRLAVVSDGPAMSQRRKVKALDLKSYCDPIILTAEWGAEYAKPSQLGFREVEIKWDVSADSCVYIADNPLKDFLGPRMCGWQTIRVKRVDGIYSTLEPEPGYEADLEVSDLHEAVSKLNLG
jgi:putative hydrolase of the HAD superfamily